MQARLVVIAIFAALPATLFAQGQGRGQNDGGLRIMDRNGDGVITQAEWRGSAQSFRNRDRNGDRRLSGNELRWGGGRSDQQDDDYFPPPNQEFDDWTEDGFDYLDSNSDGRLTRAEWFYDPPSFVRADHNRDGVLTRTEFLGDADSAPREAGRVQFDELDANGNGRIERREWNGTVQSFNALDTNRNGVLSRAEAATESGGGDRFDSLDRNRDGRVTQAEWDDDRAAFLRADRNRDNAVTRAEILALETPREERFETLDADNNGRIDRREWSGRAERFDAFDRDNNGVVTRDELLGQAAGSNPEPFAKADENRDNRLSEREWPWSRRAFVEQDVNGDNFVSRREFSPPEVITGGRLGDDNRSLTVNVLATERWTDTGIAVRDGDVLRITATGTITLSAPQDSATAGGGNRRAAGALLPNHPAGALIGKIGDGAPFFIGDGTNINRTQGAGRLYLGVNDDHLPDNSGSFRVTIGVRRQ